MTLLPTLCKLSSKVVEATTLPELVRDYNARHGAALGFRGRSTLLLPSVTLQSFFQPVVSKISAHVHGLLASAVCTQSLPPPRALSSSSFHV